MTGMIVYRSEIRKTIRESVSIMLIHVYSDVAKSEHNTIAFYGNPLAINRLLVNGMRGILTPIERGIDLNQQSLSNSWLKRISDLYVYVTCTIQLTLFQESS